MKLFILCGLLALAAAQPAKNENGKSAVDEMLDQSRSECSQKNDEIACMKFNVFNLLDQIFSKDNFKVSSTFLILYSNSDMVEFSHFYLLFLISSYFV